MSGQTRAQRALAAGLLITALAALALNAWHDYPFIADDSFISLRYAERLIEGRGLTWTDGPPVEGYSNLLWTLLYAVLGAAGVNLVLASRALGLLGMGAAVAAVFGAVRPRNIIEATAAAIGMLCLALSGPVGAWAVGGLEQPLVAGLLAWALVASAPLLDPGPTPPRRLVTPGLLLALLTLARADGAILAAALCAGVALVRGLRRGGVKTALALALPPLVALLGQLAFRRIYYDAWVPNTALAKVAFTTERLRTGATYLFGAALASLPRLALSALSANARPQTPRQRQARLASFSRSPGPPTSGSSAATSFRPTAIGCPSWCPPAWLPHSAFASGPSAARNGPALACSPPPRSPPPSAFFNTAIRRTAARCPNAGSTTARS